MRYLLPLLALAFVLFSTETFLAQQTDPGQEPPKKGDKDKEPGKDPKEMAKEGADDEPDTTPEDTKLLKELGMNVEGEELLEYIRKRTVKEADPKQVEALVRDLGDEDFVVREKAYADLAQLGSAALVGVKQAAEKSKDPETRKRAQDLKSRIEAKQEPHIQMAVARMIGRLKPQGAAEVVLNYLPYAPDRDVVDELCKALGAVAVVKGKVEPVVVKSLEDKVAIKRAAAADALARAKVADHLPAVRKLLKDGDPIVRLRTAMALVVHRDKQVVPVLIDLLKELPPEDLWPAEEVLVRLAGEKAPSVALGSNEASRKACHEAWAAWLEKNPKIDLAKLDEPTTLLGYTLIVQQSFRGRGGEVLEIDRDKKVRWRFNVQTFAVDAHIVGRDRVLVCEFQGNRISERDFKGKVLSQIGVGFNPTSVQKLSNGNIFVTGQQMIKEFDRKGKEVYSYQRFNDNIFRARKLRNGEILIINNNGNLIRLDSKNNKEIKNFFVGHQNNLFGSFDLAPNGNVIVPQPNNNRIVEFTLDGKEVSNIQVQQPNSVVRLPNGHLLVSSNNFNRISELDRKGRQVWTHQCDNGTPFNAKRR